jgi:Carboxypeptidase regulatory-like domain
MMRRLFLACILIAQISRAQSTQGVLLGQISDSITSVAVPAAQVDCVNIDTHQTVSVGVDTFGFYAVAGLSPGTYTVTVAARGYQSQQARALDMPVAGRVELNFHLRPLADLFGQGQLRTWQTPGTQQTLGFYGPDVDTSRIAAFSANKGESFPLETSRSDVIAPVAIDDLPLTGRDVYTMLLLLPGVTADTATARGLGYSVSGQRPSSSNFLLDGVDNNALLATGPLGTVVPEFIGEYRVSTGTYSAEFGRTAGFVANAITRGSTDQWHGAGFFHLENQRLDANGFQENTSGLPRAPLTQVEGGFTAAGPIVPKRLYISVGVDELRTKGLADAALYALPTASFIQSTSTASFAGSLLREFPAVAAPAGTDNAAVVSIAPPDDLRRSDEYVRLDFNPAARDRIFARFNRDALDQPQFLYSPYPAFSTPYVQASLSAALGWTRRICGAMTSDLRLARTGDAIRLQAPNSNVPQLALFAAANVTANGTQYPVVLPGPQNSYNYRNLGANYELAETFTGVTGRHVWKAGGSVFQRSIALRLGFDNGGALLFPGFQELSAGLPDTFYVEVDRFAPGYQPADPARQYRYRQVDAFAQDSFRVTRSLTIDFGLRFEWYGSPVNTGATKDTLIEPAPTGNIISAIVGAQAITPAGDGPERLYSSRESNFAPRLGLAWQIPGLSRTILRASYGIFYDRPFDNLWENAIQNRYGSAAFQNFSAPLTTGIPVSSIEALGTAEPTTQIVNGLVFQPGLRSPMVQNGFVGIQHLTGAGISFEADAIVSRGRALTTTDIVNRDGSTELSPANLFGRFNPNLGNLDYRANQGSSQYAALSGTARFRRPTFNGQLSLTWSHAEDNQSEPLANTFFDLNQFSSQQNPAPFFSAFTQQFNSNADSANSDFDQRLNFVAYAAWTPRRVITSRWLNVALRNWTLSGLAAARSGLPFSVYANQTTDFSSPIINERADLENPSQAVISEPAAGGRYLLNAAAFSAPAAAVGNSGRNAFTGPGQMSVDASLARSLHIPRTPERARLTFRADAYNMINHANLNNPDSRLTSPTFGLATYGRTENASGFPLLAPLHETARTIQLMLRVEF